MTDPVDRKFAILPVLVAGLLVAVIVQSLVILRMHEKQNQRVKTAAESSASVAGPQPTKLRPKELAPAQPSNQDEDVFGWDKSDWDPFQEMHAMQDRINQMFGGAFNRFERSDNFGDLFRGHPFAPDINVEDEGDHYLVTVDAPGLEDSKLDVKIEDQTLTISGSMQSESKQTGKGKMLREERRSGNFFRSVTLPSPVKADKMTTTTRNGVVTITIPKATD